MQARKKAKAPRQKDTAPTDAKSAPRRLDAPARIPDDCRCPITLEVMKDPVMAADGHSYERWAIEDWFKNGNKTSPCTGLELADNKLIPNHALKKTIQSLLAQSAPPTLDPMLATIAKQKANPRAPIADALLKMGSDELALEGLREEMAASRIQRFYLRRGEKGLRRWLNSSRLHERQQSLSHQLEQSSASEKKAQHVFLAKLAEQERLDKAALERLKSDYETRIKASAAKSEWEKIGQLAKEAEEAQKKLKEEQQKAIEAMRTAQGNQITGYHAEQTRLKEALQQVALAKADKLNGTLQRVKPITQLTEKLHTTEQKCQTLLEGQGQAATTLKDKIAAGRLGFTGLFKSLAKPSLDTKEAPKTEPLDAKTLKEAKEVLEHVAWGRQDEAEALFKVKPWLAFVCGEVEEPCGRKWKRVSPFQLAVWGLDWHMWEMMLRCLRDEDYVKAAEQYKELEDKGTEHGKQFSLQPLIEALQTYSEKFSGWTEQQRKDHWQKIVGGEQGKLPMSVVHEYCREDRSFEKREGMFEEKALPRWKGREKEWFHWNNSKEGVNYTYTIGGKGGDWAWYRAQCEDRADWSQGLDSNEAQVAITDGEALLFLSTVRNQQKSKLGQQNYQLNSYLQRVFAKPKQSPVSNQIKTRLTGFAKEKKSLQDVANKPMTNRPSPPGCPLHKVALNFGQRSGVFLLRASLVQGATTRARMDTHLYRHDLVFI